MKNLSVCTLALNEAAHIKKTFESVKDLAGEIIVTIDESTTDETEKIARSYTKKIYKRPHKKNFHINKQFTIEKATRPWILWLDGDEKVTSDLRFEIEKKINKKGNFYNGYFLPRKNIIFGKWIKYTGWYLDHQLRLFKKGKARFPCKRIHEDPILTGPAGYLKNPLIHYNYQTVFQFIERMNRYTTVDAKYFLKSFKRPYWRHFITRPIDEFIKRLLAFKGYKDGLHGLALSLLQAAYELVVVAKAWEIRKFTQERPDKFIRKVEKQGETILKTWCWWTRQTQIDNSENLLKKAWFKGLRKLGR